MSKRQRILLGGSRVPLAAFFLSEPYIRHPSYKVTIRLLGTRLVTTVFTIYCCNKTVTIKVTPQSQRDRVRRNYANTGVDEVQHNGGPVVAMALAGIAQRQASAQKLGTIRGTVTDPSAAVIPALRCGNGEWRRRASKRRMDRDIHGFPFAAGNILGERERRGFVAIRETRCQRTRGNGKPA